MIWFMRGKQREIPGHNEQREEEILKGRNSEKGKVHRRETERGRKSGSKQLPTSRDQLAGWVQWKPGTGSGP